MIHLKVSFSTVNYKTKYLISERRARIAGSSQMKSGQFDLRRCEEVEITGGISGV